LVYAVFFGTHHVKGSNLWKEAIWKIAPFGDFAFHGTRHAQLKLGILTPDFGPLRAALRNQFRGQGWVPIGVIEEFVASDQTDYYVGQLRNRALVPMEKSGQMDVDEGSIFRTATLPSSRVNFFSTATAAAVVQLAAPDLARQGTMGEII
jgi:hypothetical protein